MGMNLKTMITKMQIAFKVKKREKADPYKIEQDSTLLKLSFNPTENHRFTLCSRFI